MHMSLPAALHAAGLDAFLPLLLALHAVASALDALIPQPKPGSHWLPLRKLISAAAGNVLYAKGGLQPSMLTWVQRIARLLVALLPPAVIVPPGAAPQPGAQQPGAVLPAAPPVLQPDPSAKA
jgi:hypothetical protein